MIDAMGKVVIGVLTMAVCAGCTLLWDMSNILSEIRTTLTHMQKDAGKHEQHLHKHDDRIQNHEIRIIKLENK